MENNTITDPDAPLNFSGVLGPAVRSTNEYTGEYELHPLIPAPGDKGEAKNKRGRGEKKRARDKEADKDESGKRRRQPRVSGMTLERDMERARRAKRKLHAFQRSLETRPSLFERARRRVHETEQQQKEEQARKQVIDAELEAAAGDGEWASVSRLLRANPGTKNPEEQHAFIEERFNTACMRYSEMDKGSDKLAKLQFRYFAYQTRYLAWAESKERRLAEFEKEEDEMEEAEAAAKKIQGVQLTGSRPVDRGARGDRITSYFQDNRDARRRRLLSKINSEYFDSVCAGKDTVDTTKSGSALELIQNGRESLKHRFEVMMRSQLGRRRFDELEAEERDAMLMAHSGLGEVCDNPGCGAVDNFVVDPVLATKTCAACATSRPLGAMGVNFKDLDHLGAPTRKTAPYNPETHFRDHLERMVGIEIKAIPAAVQVQILEQLARRGVEPLKDPHAVTAKLVRQILKDLKYARYFGHTTKIIRILTADLGVPPPLSVVEMALLKKLYSEYIEAYEALKHKFKRRNKLKYTYTLYKLCVMCGFNQYLPFIHTFESRAKEVDAEMVWQKIVEYNRGRGLEDWVWEPIAI